MCQLVMWRTVRCAVSHDALRPSVGLVQMSGGDDSDPDGVTDDEGAQ